VHLFLALVKSAGALLARAEVVEVAVFVKARCHAFVHVLLDCLNKLSRILSQQVPRSPGQVLLVIHLLLLDDELNAMVTLLEALL